MKRFAWVQNAVQALALDDRASIRSHDNEQDSDSEYYKEDEIIRIGSRKQKLDPQPKPWGRLSLVKRSRNTHHFDPPVDVLGDSVTSLQPPAASATAKLSPSDSSAKAENEICGPASTGLSKEPLHDASLSLEYNPAVLAYISDSQLPKPNTPFESKAEESIPKSPKRNANSSTIFQSSPKTRIAITLTAPDDEAPTESDPPRRNSFNYIRYIRNSSTPLPTTKTLTSSSADTLPIQLIDSSRLMPPTENVLDDTRRIRKAHELREVREFMISFLNMKGATFPEQLRFQMMNFYGIREADLHPETVAKFNSRGSFLEHVQDEGVALDDEGNKEQQLRILESAFRSRIEEVTPKRNSVPVPAIRPQPPPNQRTGPERPNLRSRSETGLATFADDDNLPLAWLAPLISKSSSDLAPLPHSVTKTRSTPNLGERALQHKKVGFSCPETATEESQEARQTRARRNGRLSGAFGAMREAMLGRKSYKVG